jgi:DNA-binding response OmpR family regulator
MHDDLTRRALVVEDETVVAMLIEDMLADIGFTVVWAPNLSKAVAIAQSGDFSLAVLDVNLGGSANSFPVADILTERGIPFLFSTGYGRGAIDPRFAARPALQKPFRQEALAEAIRGLSRGPGNAARCS